MADLRNEAPDRFTRHGRVAKRLERLFVRVSSDFRKPLEAKTRPVRSDLQHPWYPPKHSVFTQDTPHPHRSVIHCPLYFLAIGVKNKEAKFQILTLLFSVRLDQSMAFGGG